MVIDLDDTRPVDAKDIRVEGTERDQITGSVPFIFSGTLAVELCLRHAVHAMITHHPIERAVRPGERMVCVVHRCGHVNCVEETETSLVTIIPKHSKLQIGVHPAIRAV